MSTPTMRTETIDSFLRALAARVPAPLLNKVAGAVRAELTG